MRDWSTACLDWEDRIRTGRSLVPDLPLFLPQADRGERVFRRLRIPDIHGTPRLGDASGEWVFPIVRAVFGCYDPDELRRWLREFFLLLPKGNGKSSTVAAPIVLTAIIVNVRPAAEHVLIAPSKLIADTAFNQIEGTIKLDPELDKTFHRQRNIRRITHRESEATIEVKAADTDVITGSKAMVTVVDETHEFAKKAKAAAVFTEVRGALAKRPDGFLLQITTQSKDQPAGVFREEVQVARDVRDGKIKMPILPILYELPEDLAKDGGWKHPSRWPLVNPNLGRSVDPAFLRDEIQKAEMKGAAALVLLASQHFNIEIGIGLRSDGWAGAEYWEAAAEPGLTLDTLLERSEVATIGIDGGGLDDLLALSVIGRERGTRRWLHWARAWASPIVLERRKSEAPRLLDLAKDGDLVLVENIEEDVSGVVEVCQRVQEAGLLPEKAGIGVDQAGIGGIADGLDEVGLAGDLIVGIAQGWRMNGAIKTVERKLANRTFVHCGQPLMAWAVGNCKVTLSGNAVVITKAASGVAKIDPAMAKFNAASLMSLNPVAASGAVIYAL